MSKGSPDSELMKSIQDKAVENAKKGKNPDLSAATKQVDLNDKNYKPE
ncbi:MAG: hypothetical protein IJ133_06145 [Clostridia bacterium]|nr:hypothetical protein [Clostridia bacterium]